MTKKRKPRRGIQPPTPPVASLSPGIAGAQRRRRPTWAIALGALVIVLVAAAIHFATNLRPASDSPSMPGSAPAAPPAATPVRDTAYVGGAACAACHRKEHEAWLGSHHQRAMAEATEASVLGNFADAKFSHAGTTSIFFRRDGRWFVHTDGPDGKPADFEIRYTFGVTPLQQYLIELPRGRLQAFGVAWDARPAQEGGQRWFHLYPQHKLKAGDPLHWTGNDQTWNHQCADCHSTNLRKNYDAQNRRYATAWTDISVGCEACHGPGSSHVEWAQPGREAQRADQPAKGLVVVFDERRGASWAIDPRSGNAARSQPRTTSREIETCARCHARRSQFSDRWRPGERFGDGFRAALIEPGLYHDDGQQNDEVFTVGSFLGSRMHAMGVTCSDCHDPHSATLRAPGNAVCARCHQADRYDAGSHHHHAAASKGAACAACHMPAKTYMIVDPRHDHGLRIPRPDRTVRFGIPNACNACHADRKPEWAAAALATWFASPKPGFQSFAESFALAGRGAPGAAQALRAVATDRRLGGFVRASAIRRLVDWPGRQTMSVLGDALTDSESLVRAAAADALQEAEPVLRARLLPSLLGDPVREVRMAAARSLAGAPEAALSPADRSRFEIALDEYTAAERFSADRPENQANLGNLHAARGRPAEAEAAWRSALALDPSYFPAAMGLAQLQSRRGDEAAAERSLRSAIAREPRSAPLHLALGLSLVRQQRHADALRELAQAATLAPGEARYTYVHAVALNDAGERDRALREVERSLARHPWDRDLLGAAAAFERAAGRRDRALVHARRLVEVDPDNLTSQQLVQSLGGGR